MAEGFARARGLDAASAGTQPAAAVNPTAVELMRELDIDISAHRPALLDFGTLAAYDRVITMGCGVQESCPALHTDEDWGLDDPVGQPVETFRAIRDDIRARVDALAATAAVADP